MNKRKTYDAPQCPYCETELMGVFETNRLIYEFDREKGKYIETHGEAEMRCPDCNADMYDVFSDGVCNSSAK